VRCLHDASRWAAVVLLLCQQLWDGVVATLPWQTVCIHIHFDTLGTGVVALPGSRGVHVQAGAAGVCGNGCGWEAPGILELRGDLCFGRAGHALSSGNHGLGARHPGGHSQLYQDNNSRNSERGRHTHVRHS
jgi:hypothetical protein